MKLIKPVHQVLQAILEWVSIFVESDVPPFSVNPLEPVTLNL